MRIGEATAIAAIDYVVYSSGSHGIARATLPCYGGAALLAPIFAPHNGDSPL